MKICLAIPILLFILAPCLSQDNPIQKFSTGITELELKDHVKILSSDEFMGRETGYEGQQKAAAYIAGDFKHINLIGPQSGDNPFLQKFSLVKNGWDQFMVIKGTDTLQQGKELHVTGIWPEGDQTLDVVFIGYGVDSEHYSDYNDINVKGKIVAFLNGEPMDKNGRFLSTASFVPKYSIVGYDKARIAAEKGAIGSILIDPDQSKIDKMIDLKKRFSSNQQFFLPESGKGQTYDSGMIAIGQELASLLFGNNAEDWSKYEKKLNKGKSVSGDLETRIRIVSEKGSNKIIAENVIGLIKGAELPDEYVIITAHYDHLGQRDDKIFYGADDNASGTAAVMEIAEAFEEAYMAGFKPKRSIIFMPVAGEEKGLLGSKYYTQNPIVPLENTKAALNMDMIGRQDGYPESDSSYVFIYMSADPGSELDRAAQTASTLVGDNMKSIYKYKGANEISLRGSDHVSFEDEGVPVLYFYCGSHKDYHRPTDTWEKLDYQNLARISRVVFASAWELANQN